MYINLYLLLAFDILDTKCSSSPLTSFIHPAATPPSATSLNGYEEEAIFHSTKNVRKKMLWKIIAKLFSGLQKRFWVQFFPTINDDFPIQTKVVHRENDAKIQENWFEKTNKNYEKNISKKWVFCNI